MASKEPPRDSREPAAKTEPPSQARTGQPRAPGAPKATPPKIKPIYSDWAMI